MFGKKMLLILGLLLISMFSLIGCEDGTLELNGEPDDSQITQARVRVDGEVIGIYNPKAIPPLELRGGGHLVSVEFLNAEGKVVRTHGPKVIKIEAGQTVQIPIDSESSDGTSGGRYKGYKIAILTDFGNSLPFISGLEGAIRAADPNADIIFSRHDVPAFDIESGAFLQLLTARNFPPETKTIFVAIVIPGGKAERNIIIETTDNRCYIGPDNGLLAHTAREVPLKMTYQITNQKLFPEESLEIISPTRLFGRTAGLLTSGKSNPEDFGTPRAVIQDVQGYKPPNANPFLSGSIIYIDTFGNCVTGIPKALVEQYGLAPKQDKVQVEVGENKLLLPYVTIYSDVPQGDALAFVSGFHQFLELSINFGNFSQTYKVNVGQPVQIRKIP